MKLTQVLAFVLLVLLGVIYYQGCKINSLENQPVKRDTVVQYVEVHDTVPGKPKLIKIIDKDTVFYPKIEYLPHPDYEILLSQYENLIVKHFSKNVFQTTVPIKYGIATIIDTVTENKSIGNQLILDVMFPEKIITVTKFAPPTRNLYAGTMVTGGRQQIVNSVNLGLLYKDKTDKIFGASIGLNGSGQFQYGISSYIKIK